MMWHVCKMVCYGDDVCKVKYVILMKEDVIYNMKLSYYEGYLLYLIYIDIILFCFSTLDSHDNM